MVRHQYPGIAAGRRLVEDTRETSEKIIPVVIVSKDHAPLYSSPHDVVNGTRRVYTGLAGHILMIGRKLKN